MGQTARRVALIIGVIAGILASTTSEAAAQPTLTGTVITKAPGLVDGGYHCGGAFMTFPVTASGTYGGAGTEAFRYTTTLGSSQAGTGTITSATLTFSFVTPDGTRVTGSKTLAATGTSTFTCAGSGAGWHTQTASFPATYTATITTTNGRSYTDRGTSQVEIHVESMAHSLTETFQSAQSEALPVNRAPDCSGVTASPSRLDAPAARTTFSTVRLSGATDLDGDPLTYRVDAITQDEPVLGVGIGDPTEPDARLTSVANDVLLRAERNPQGNGRVYRVAYTVSDGTATCSGVATVGVAGKRGQTAVADRATSLYDSFTGARLR